MKIWVSGAAGFIGHEVLKMCNQRGHQVWGFDAFDETLYPNDIRRFRSGHLTDLGLSVSHWNPNLSPIPDNQFLPDVVINEMAVPGLTPSWTSITSYMSSNVSALGNLLLKLQNANSTPFVVQASTSSVYGDRPLGGDPAFNPKSPYGVSKLAAELLLKAWSRNVGFDYTILRYHSVYGNEQRPDMAFHKFIKAGLEGRPITVNGNGEQVRTNTHVSDVAIATILAAEKQVSKLECDISGFQPISLNDAIKVIEKSMGIHLRQTKLPTPAGDQIESIGDPGTASKELGWEPTVQFEEGIRQQLESIKGMYGFE